MRQVTTMLMTDEQEKFVTAFLHTAGIDFTDEALVVTKDTKTFKFSEVDACPHCKKPILCSMCRVGNYPACGSNEKLCTGKDCPNGDAIISCANFAKALLVPENFQPLKTVQKKTVSKKRGKH